MLNRITKLFKDIASGCIVIFLFYFAIASIVFALRHPWATRTEQMIHIGDALMFNKISYKEMREEYEER
jgi:hypothetical protein